MRGLLDVVNLPVALHSDQPIFLTSTRHGQAAVDGGTEDNAPIVVGVIAQKFDPAGGVSFCTHDHEIILQSGRVELNVFSAS